MMVGSAGSASGGGSPSTPPSPASFVWDRGSTIPPSTIVNFTDTSPNTPTSWSWEINGVEFSIDQNPSYLFTTVASYNIKLTATNFFGSASVTHVITVSSGGGS
jgi:PKD repeat protein